IKKNYTRFLTPTKHNAYLNGTTPTATDVNLDECHLQRKRIFAVSRKGRRGSIQIALTFAGISGCVMLFLCSTIRMKYVERKVRERNRGAKAADVRSCLLSVTR